MITSDVLPTVPPVVHELKCVDGYFNDVYYDIKNFEVRLNDRNFRLGDVLWLREISLTDNQWNYTGRTCTRIVKYILDDSRFVLSGYVIMGLE